MKNKAKAEDLIIVFNTDLPSYENVRLAFDKIIGPLTIATIFEEFKPSHNNFKEILSTIAIWSSNYEVKKDLSLIDHRELLKVYEKLEELNGEYITKVESEISDEIVIWFWNLMLLRKAQIEQ